MLLSTTRTGLLAISEVIDTFSALPAELRGDEVQHLKAAMIVPLCFESMEGYSYVRTSA